MRTAAAAKACRVLQWQQLSSTGQYRSGTWSVTRKLRNRALPRSRPKRQGLPPEAPPPWPDAARTRSIQDIAHSIVHTVVSARFRTHVVRRAGFCPRRPCGRSRLQERHYAARAAMARRRVLRRSGDPDFPSTARGTDAARKSLDTTTTCYAVQKRAMNDRRTAHGALDLGQCRRAHFMLCDSNAKPRRSRAQDLRAT